MNPAEAKCRSKAKAWRIFRRLIRAKEVPSTNEKA
jgi:hypothetical protein